MEHTHHGPPSDQPEHTGAESETHAHHSGHAHETGAMTDMEHGGHEMPPSGEMAHAGHSRGSARAAHGSRDPPPPTVASRAAHQGHGAGQHDAGQAGSGHGAPRRPHRPRADVPPALLGLAAALASRCCSTAPCSRSWLGFTMPAFPGSAWIAPALLRGRLPLRRPALPADGRARAAQPPAGHDDADLAGHHAWPSSTAWRPCSCPGRGLLLGAGHADRHHAAGPLAGDAQRAPGLRRAGRAGQADARHRRAHAARRQRRDACRSSEPAQRRPGAGAARAPASRPMARWRRASRTSTRR